MNMEEFIIKLGFSDKDAIKGIKSFLKKVEQVNKETAKTISQQQKEFLMVEKRLRKEQEKELKRQTDIEVAAIKKKQSIQDEAAKIEQARRKQAVASITAQNSELKKMASFYKEMERSALKLSRENERFASIQDRLLSGRKFRSLQLNDPREAEDFKRRIEKAVTERDVAELRTLKSQLGEVSMATKTHTKAVLGLATAQQGLIDSTRHLIRSYVSLFAILEGTTAINRIGQDFEAMRASMLLSSGNSAQAAKDLAFVNAEAKRLGLNLKDATEGFIKFSFAAKNKLTDQQTKELFTGFSEFATALGVDKFRYEKGLQALQQINVHCLPIQ